MSEVMEADLPQAVFLDDPGEMLGDVVRAEQAPHLIDADVVEVVLAVRAAEQTAVRLLPLLLPPEQVFDRRQERQSADTGFGFEHVLALQDALAALRQLDDLVTDGDGLVLEVNRVPLESQHLAAPQAVVGGDADRGFQRVALDDAEQSEHFLPRIMRRLIAVLARLIHAVGGIAVDDVLLHRVLERPVQHGVVVDDRVRRVAVVQNRLIEGLELRGRQRAEGHAQFAEVAVDAGVHHTPVAVVGRRRDRGADHLQPRLHIVGKEDFGFVRLGRLRKQLAVFGERGVEFALAARFVFDDQVIEQGFRLALVAALRQPERDPLGFALAVHLEIENGVVFSVFDLQVAGQHCLSLSFRCRGRPPLTAQQYHIRALISISKAEKNNTIFLRFRQAFPALCGVGVRAGQVFDDAELGDAVAPSDAHTAQLARGKQAIRELSADAAEHPAKLFHVDHVGVLREHIAFVVLHRFPPFKMVSMASL